MKCPQCNSTNTKKVSVIDVKWHVGHERCNECGYQDDWGKFCTPPILFRINPHKIIIPMIDEDLWIKNKQKL